jgi:hypothetical protein
MPNFPYFRFPNYNYKHYSQYNYKITPPSPLHNFPQEINTEKNINPNTKNSNIKKENKPNIPSLKKDTSTYIDILGIKIQFDDILILSLIYFLYTEKVQDDWLFLALLLLLLS